MQAFPWFSTHMRKNWEGLVDFVITPLPPFLLSFEQSGYQSLTYYLTHSQLVLKVHVKLQQKWWQIRYTVSNGVNVLTLLPRAYKWVRGACNTCTR